MDDAAKHGDEGAHARAAVSAHPMGFSPALVGRALRDPAVASVTVLERLPSAGAQVARLEVARVARPPLRAIGKLAAGPAVADARRELRFFAQIAPLWPHPPPRHLPDQGRRGSEQRQCQVPSPGHREPDRQWQNLERHQ